MPELTFKNKSLGEYRFKKGASVTIGRQADNDVVIDDPAVSGYHALIDFVGDRLMLNDLKSKNGSFVNEQLVNSHWLNHGDVIIIGGHTLVLNYPEGATQLARDPDKFSDTLPVNSIDHGRMTNRSNPKKR